MHAEHKQVLFLDMGGVTHPRHPFQVKAVLNRMLHDQSIYQPPQEIPHIDRTVSDEPLTPAEKIIFVYYLAGSIFMYPDAKALLPVLREHADIYLNTGVPNKTPFVKLVTASFQRHGIDGVFKGKFFTPAGIPVLHSKLDPIQEAQPLYAGVTVVDDDPTIAIPIKRRFRNTDTVVIGDLSSGILFWGVDNPGVRRVRTFRQATRGLLRDRQPRIIH